MERVGDDEWSAVRVEFPIATRATYLNTASAAPVPRRAAERGQQYYAELLTEGDAAWARWEPALERVRAQVAELLHAPVDDIAFTAGASHGLTLVAALLGPPAHVVAMADEFPRVTIPFGRHGDDITLVPSDPAGVVPIERIADAIQPSTRAVITSAVMHGTGFRQDLAALSRVCRARRVPLIVDASQAVGIVPVDVDANGIDALVFAGYKGTMGGHGSGAMYVRGTLLEGPDAARWRRARDQAPLSDRERRRTTPSALLELGAPPLAALLALGGGLELLSEVGMPRVEQRVHALTEYLHSLLDARGLVVASPRPRAQRAGITVVRMADAATVVRALAAAGIVASARGEGIRVSVHIFNVEEDLDRFVDALAAIRDGRSVPSHPQR